MLIRSDFEVAAPVEKVWQFFDDIPQVAACLPGTELTKELGDDKYEGRVAVRMGPVRLQFGGTAEITERDEAAKRVVIHASGAELRGRGQANMVVTATLAGASAEARAPGIVAARDPVCGMAVTAGSSRPARYEGTDYYFCCAGCRQAFEQDPDAYLKKETRC